MIVELERKLAKGWPESDERRGGCDEGEVSGASVIYRDKLWGSSMKATRDLYAYLQRRAWVARAFVCGRITVKEQYDQKATRCKGLFSLVPMWRPSLSRPALSGMTVPTPVLSTRARTAGCSSSHGGGGGGEEEDLLGLHGEGTGGRESLSAYELASVYYGRLPSFTSLHVYSVFSLERLARPCLVLFRRRLACPSLFALGRGEMTDSLAHLHIHA